MPLSKCFCGLFAQPSNSINKQAKTVPNRADQDCHSIFKLSAPIDPTIDKIALVRESFARAADLIKIHQVALSAQNFGSTCSLVMMDQKGFTAAHVGDSPILVFEKNKTGWKLVYQSSAHDPQHPDEQKRILPSNIITNSHISNRLKNEQGSGGLAVTRAFGDFHYTKSGLITEPEIFSQQWSDDALDAVVFVASDGANKFLTTANMLIELKRLSIWDSLTAHVEDIIDTCRGWDEDDDITVTALARSQIKATPLILTVTDGHGQKQVNLKSSSSSATSKQKESYKELFSQEIKERKIPELLCLSLPEFIADQLQTEAIKITSYPEEPTPEVTLLIPAQTAANSQTPLLD